MSVLGSNGSRFNKDAGEENKSSKHEQTRTRVIRMVVPNHFDQERFDIGVVFPFTGVTQPTMLEPVARTMGLPRHVDWQDILDNIGRPLFFLNFLTDDMRTQDLQDDIYVPMGMVKSLTERYRNEEYVYRRVPQGRDMTLLDMLVSDAQKNGHSLDWLFNYKWTKEEAMQMMGFVVNEEYSKEPAYRTGENVFTYLRHLSGQGMRRQDDFVLHYAVSYRQLPTGELLHLLEMPLSTVEHFIKNHP